MNGLRATPIVAAALGLAAIVLTVSAAPGRSAVLANPSLGSGTGGRASATSSTSLDPYTSLTLAGSFGTISAVVYDGNVAVQNSSRTTVINGFTAPSGALTARTTYVVSDGQCGTAAPNGCSGGAVTIGSNDTLSFTGGAGTLNDGPDAFRGSDGCPWALNTCLWDTRNFDVSTQVAPGSTSASVNVRSAVDSTGRFDCLNHEAQVFAVGSPAAWSDAGYVAAGKGLRNQASGTITVAGIPLGTRVVRALLYWNILGTQDPGGALSFNGTSLSGSFIAQDAEPCWMTPTASYAYRAEVTPLVSGNGTYTISGYPTGTTGGLNPWTYGSSNPMMEGASLIVFYEPESAVQPPPLEQSNGTCGIGVHAYSRSACRAQGVNTRTGAFTTQVTDLELPGIGVPFKLTRTYTSSDPNTRALLGRGWTHSFATALIDQGAPPVSTAPTAASALGDHDILLYGDDGQRILYTLQQGGTYLGPPGALSTLAHFQGNFDVVSHDQVLYRFDPQDGRLAEIKDRNNQGLTFAYNGPSDEIQTITDSVGRQIAVQYTGGLLTRVTLPDGRYVAYGYTSGLLTSVRDVRGHTTQYFYDAGGRLEKIVDQKAHQVVRNVYDAAGERVTDQYDALENHTHFDWDAQLETSTMTDARSNEWKDVYSANLVVQRVNPLGNTTRLEYDSHLDVTKITDPRGNATTMTYDENANLRTRTAPAPLLYVEQWTYTPRNDVDTHTDGRTNVTDYEYDGAGNLIWIEGPDADGPGPLGKPKTLYGRDPGGTGLLKSITDARGKQTLFSYTNGDLTEIQTQVGNRTTMTYDTGGRLRTLVDPRGYAAGNNASDFTWLFTPNEANQLLFVTSPDPDGAGTGDPPSVTGYTYDDAGNLETRTDANTHVTTYVYDDANRLESVTAPDPDGAGTGDPAPVTSYDYDAVGNLTTRTDAEGHVTTYDYDVANRLERVTAPLSRVWTYGYDANGNLNQVVDANGNATPTAGDGQTIYGYDNLNRLNVINYSDTTTGGATFTYDANGNRASMNDGGIETYAYDALNRVTSVSRASESNVFSYVYDLVNLTQTTFPGGSSTTYAYDNDERLQSVTADALTTTYGYDEAANLKTTTLPSANGYVETRTYDRAGRLTVLENKKAATTLSKFAISPDPVGNPRSVVRTGTLAQTQSYTYDFLDRLKGVCFQAGTCPGANDPYIRWTYDRVGNRKTEVRPAGTTNYTYNAADELTQAGTTTFGYDQNGNQTAKGTQTFAYDLANRLRTHVSGTTTTTYTYDGDGKRLKASTGTQASKNTKFLWDVNQPLPQLALERDGSNAPIRRYVYGARRISQVAGTSTSYYLYDGLGSVANLTSSNGATQWTWSYEPFGAIRTETKASGNQPTNVHKFTGEYADPTGLYHLRARQYDPQIGRFLSRDPVAGGHAYAYVGNGPTAFIDPSGALQLPRGYYAICLWCGGSKAAHTALDVAGLVPVLGEPADGANCIWYGAEGNYVDAALSCAGVVPFIGVAATGAKWGRRAVRLGNEATEVAGAEVAYHYTFREAVASIKRNGLRPGSYATPNGTLSPLQAQIDLALPPNRGLANALLRVDVAGLRKAGYEIPTVTHVGRSFSMPGGGYELQFPYAVPPEYLSVVSR